MTIDLRSDTVTQPTPEMRRAMAEAEVGDDVFEEDPTVQRLEARVAGLLGHEAALFVSSGSMGNGVAVRTHCAAGDEVVAEYDSHVFNNEVGSTAALSGAQVHPLRGEGGILTAAQIESTIRSEDVHHSDTRLVCIENTHNFAGGAVYPVETLREISALCAGRGIGRHLDGARLWNASAETGISLDTYARLFDSVSVCLSKGLGAPVGSVLVGSRHFIHRARRFRKMFGGGMRQAGILAAAGLYALEHNLPRLKEDHENAREFARRACEIPGVRLGQARVDTNIVFLDTEGTGRPAAEVMNALGALGVRVFDTGQWRFRAVFHLHVSRQDAVRAAECLAETVTSVSRPR